jgi:Papain-like cysteine protease AvrRpt2
MAKDLLIEPRQLQTNWCWAAVASTLAGYFVRPISQCEVASTIVGNGVNCCNGNEAECNQPQDLDNVLDRLNAMLPKPMEKTAFSRPMRFNEVQDAIDAGVPVCVRIEWIGGGGHFVMITGYSISESNLGWIDVCDPLFPDSTLPFEFFASHYMLMGHWTHSYVMRMQ